MSSVEAGPTRHQTNQRGDHAGLGLICVRSLVPLLAALLILTVMPGCAEPSDTNLSDSEPVGLRPLDWAIIGLYACATVSLGFYFGRQQRSTKEYFSGSGSMSPLLIGVSLFATLLSTISYRSMPGEAAGMGPVMLFGLLSYPFIYFVVGYWLLPCYMQHRVTSAYELLEERLGLSVRLLGASMFLALRLVWMAVMSYVTAEAMAVMAGLHANWIPLIVVVTALISIVYTSLGGLRAVIVTDSMQTVLLFLGALLVVATVTYEFGGFGWFPTEWHSNWDHQPVFSLDPGTRVTVVGTILSIFVWNVATLGGDQTSVQRFMATRDANAARAAISTKLWVGVLVQATLFLVGFAILAFFQAHPNQLPEAIDIKENADDLFPRYISYHLPVGVSGLVVAAMFAAAMSSIDSGVNSITAVVMTDFMKRLGWAPRTERGNIRTARLLALLIGAVVVLGSFYIKYIEGNITGVTNKTVNLLTTPIFALFYFALFARRVTTLGVWIGAVCGVTTAATIAFSGPLVYLVHQYFGVDPGVFGTELITQTAEGITWTTAVDPISFQWISPVALIVNIGAGTLASRLFGSQKKFDS